MTTTKKWTVGYLLPRVLIIVCLLDVMLRFAEVHFGAFKAARAIPHSNTPDAPFEPNVRVKLPLIYGDLANMANLRDSSEIRSVQFSTDTLGFRNTGATGRVEGALFGDSFSWSGDRDEDSLPAQLGQRLGCRIYNAAGFASEFRRPNAAQINAVAERIGLDNGDIIIAEVERRSFERIRAQNPARDRRETFWARLGDDFRKLFRTSPVKRYAEDTLRFIYDDRILPNVYADNVVQGKLRNGDVMSFLPLDLRSPSRAFAVPIEYWTNLKRDLAKAHRRLFVVLVPNKYTIYQGSLADQHKWPMYGDELLSRNEAALRSLKIPVVNLAPALRAHAEAGIDRHEYLYWRNDTHWNRRGVSIAAAEIVRALPEVGQSCKR